MNIADEIDRCVARTHGLELVMQGICDDNPGPLYQGAWQLVQDLGDKLRDLSASISKEGKSDLSPKLAELIEAHKAAYANMMAEGDIDNDHSDSSQQDDAAALAVAIEPVASEAELLAKLHYLLNYEKSLWTEPHHGTEFGLVSIALDAYFKSKKGSAQANATA